MMYISALLELFTCHSSCCRLSYLAQLHASNAVWCRSGMASVRSLSSAASSESRRVSGSGEQPALSSPRDLARPGSAAHLQENGAPGDPRRLCLSACAAGARSACRPAFTRVLAHECISSFAKSRVPRLLRHWHLLSRLSYVTPGYQVGDKGFFVAVLALQVAPELCQRRSCGEARRTGSRGWRCALRSPRCAALRPRWPRSAAQAPAACCPASSDPPLSPGRPHSPLKEICGSL